jgi:hypothetical protein
MRVLPVSISSTILPYFTRVPSHNSRLVHVVFIQQSMYLSTNDISSSDYEVRDNVIHETLNISVHRLWI